MNFFQKRLWIIEGINKSKDKYILLNDVIVYDPKIDKWYKMKDFPTLVLMRVQLNTNLNYM